MRLLLVMFVSLTIVFIACSEDTSSVPGPPLTNYDQSCTTDDDCARVFTSNPCSCGCEVGAVNKREQSRYNTDWNNVKCGDRPVCGACADSRAFCTAGKCAAENCPGACPAKDAGAD